MDNRDHLNSQTKSGEIGSGAGPSNLNTGSSTHTDSQVRPTPTAPYCCPKCGRGYNTRSGRSKHLKDCGKNDRTACDFCGKQFGTFAQVRCHERVAHPAQYMAVEESKLKISDSEVFTTIAELEVRNANKNTFLLDISKATGLSRDQVKYRRTRPVYAEYLKIAREKLAAEKSKSGPGPKTKTTTKTNPDNRRHTLSAFLTKLAPRQSPNPIDGQSASTSTKPKPTGRLSLPPPRPSSTPSDGLTGSVTASPPPPSPLNPPDLVNISSGDEDVFLTPSAPEIPVASAMNAKRKRATPPATPEDSTPKRFNMDLSSQTMSRGAKRGANWLDDSVEQIAEERVDCDPPDTPLAVNIISNITLVPAPSRPRSPTTHRQAPVPLHLGDGLGFEGRDEEPDFMTFTQLAAEQETLLSPPQQTEGEGLQYASNCNTGSGGTDQIVGWLRAALESEADRPETDRRNIDTVAIIQSALVDSDRVLGNVLDTWLDTTFYQKLGRRNNNTGQRDRLTQTRITQFTSTSGQAAINNPSTQANIHNSANYAQRYTGRGLRASNYKKAQDLYSKNRATLASAIMEGKSLQTADKYPSMERVENFYRGILEAPMVEDHEPIEETKTSVVDTERPFTATEIDQAKTGWAMASAGPDLIPVPVVKNVPSEILAILFNVIYHRKFIPKAWRQSRTTLIPKEGDKEDPANWRPITVSSAFLRLFHRVLAKRLKDATVLNLNQRGFINLDGTLANTMVVHHYIRNRIEARKAYNVLSIDLRKAFDTVNQSSVLRAMRRVGLSEHICAYVGETFKSATTTIKIGNNSSGPIKINRGVKQGDPLSPILFNFVVDELLCDLDRFGRGGSLDDNIVDDVRCSSLAFADDIVILENDDKYIPLDLHHIDAFFKKRGMELNADKCSLLSAALVPRGGKVIPRSRPFIRHNGALIKSITNFDTAKYLGHKLGASGIQKPSIANLATWMANVERAPLKPDQKLNLIKQYVIPKVLYGLQNPKITGRILREADRLIKYRLKRILHLNVHTPDASLYARVRDGGLGITPLRYAIPKIYMGRLQKLLNADNRDIALSFVMQSPRTLHLMNRMHGLTGNTPYQIYWADQLKASPLLSGLEESSADVASRAWIDNRPHGWTGRDYVRAVQLRTNNLPTAGIPSNPVERRKCRAGCQRVESISHVLQGCPATHFERIKRHNEIAKKISKHCRDKLKLPTTEEPHVRHDDGTLFKPDIITIKHNTVIVCDIQVMWEGSTSLANSHNNKRLKYEEDRKFRTALEKLYPGKDHLFAPITIGARGVWPQCNDVTEVLLAIDRPLKASCVQSALKWASSIHASFMRRVWRGQQQQQHQ